MTWKDLFRRIEDDDDEPAKASLPSPAAIPGSSAPVRSALPLPSAPRQVDKASLDAMEASLLSSAPDGYKTWVGHMNTLAAAIPSEDLLYKAVLTLSAKQGISAAGLVADVDRCVRVLEEQAKAFAAELDAQISKKVGGRQKEVERIDAEMARLQNELATLTTKRAEESAAITTDTARIEEVRENFAGAYNFKQSQLLDQKNKLTIHGKG